MLVDITQCATYSMNFISRTHHQWWVACVLQTEVNDEVKVSFLHPNGPSRSFRYPHRPDILNIPLSDILTKVDPRTVTGRVYYTLTPKESRDALKIAKK